MQIEIAYNLPSNFFFAFSPLLTSFRLAFKEAAGWVPNLDAWQKVKKKDSKIGWARRMHV